MRNKPALPPDPIEFLGEMQLNTGETVGDLQEKHPVMLVFLRHFGCSFCREAMAEIAKKRTELEMGDKKIVFVHMGTPEIAEVFFKKYKLFPAYHVSDPATRFYHIFGLLKGTARQTFGLMNWIRGFEAAVIEGHGAANPAEGSGLGDGFQMPGVFMIYRGVVFGKFIHKNPYDRPDYAEIANCCSI